MSPFTLIRTPAQLRALASPLRQEILDVVSASGACTIAELATTLGRAPDSLYFHVRRLLKVGLLIESEPRKDGRHVAGVYDVPARPMKIDQAAAPAGAMEAVASAILRLAARDYKRALREDGVEVEGPQRRLWVGRYRAWLTPDEIARANRLITQLHDLFNASAPGPGKKPVAFAWVLTPSSPKKTVPRAQGGRAKKPAPRPSPRSLTPQQPRP